ncbi:MAG: hypothetical protein GY832_29700 [Chloroflexi bacterium]|nr:hypothetical protein [Chloroflexota bacterium]
MQLQHAGTRLCGKNTSETQCRPIVHPGSPIGESAQVEGGQVNGESHVLIGDDVVKSAPSPSSPGLPRWCSGLFPWGGGGGMRGGGGR